MNQGTRLQVIVLKISKDNELKKHELYHIRDYLRENYTVVSFSYGSPKNSIRKTLENLFQKNLVHSPITMICEITDVFIDKNKIIVGELINHCEKKQAQKFVKTFDAGIKKLSGA